MTEVTQILSQIEQGDPSAAERLLPLVYQELRNLAAAKMAQESPDHTLQATALVHEAYMRLVDVDQTRRWDSRGHFFGAAAEAMRRILVESARRKSTLKRGGDSSRSSAFDVPLVRDPGQLLSVHEILDDLAAVDPQSAELVKLRYFVGLTVEEAAECLGLSVRKAKYVWAYARSWLREQMAE